MKNNGISNSTLELLKLKNNQKNINDMKVNSLNNFIKSDNKLKYIKLEKMLEMIRCIFNQKNLSSMNYIILVNKIYECQNNSKFIKSEIKK